MKTIKQFLMAIIALLAISFTSISCSDDDNGAEDKGEAILLITFGSSYDLPQATFKHIEDEFKAANPGVEVRWAYTSYIIRNILSKRGVDVDSPIDALTALKKDGYSTISTQSLHIIPGAEYNEVKDTIAYFNKKENMSATYGNPLLFDNDDLNEVADILIKKFKTQLDAGESVVLMGHGTHHKADDRYQKLQNAIDAKTDASLFVGTVEGKITLDDVKEKLAKTKSKKITLTPLMSVAGDHAANDMAGGYPEKDNEEFAGSWNGELSALGYDVTIVMKGLGDYDEIVKMWLNHYEESK